MKVLCGIYPHGPTKAKLFLREKRFRRVTSANRTQRYRHHSSGIGPGERIDVLENIFLGNEITHNGIMDYD